VRDNKRAGSVINNLRAMVSKRPASRERCDIHELVHEVVDLMRSELMEARIEVRTEMADMPLHVQAARVELQQVLVNLFLNAIHAMKDTLPEARQIVVKTRQETNRVRICLRDHGHGIAPDRLPRIFEPFRSTKSNGLGMGLSICRRIIEGNGGRIEARNHADGACFTCDLPLV